MSRRKHKIFNGRDTAESPESLDAVDDIPFEEPPASGNWITDYAWISGLAGAVMVVVCAAVYNQTNALNNGVYFAGNKLTHTRDEGLLLALVIVALSMLITEGIRLYLRDRKNFFQLDPHLKDGRYLAFLSQAVANWLLYLGLLGLAVLFFRTAGEYGYARNAPYYQIFFRFIDLAFITYLWVGLPYVLITRALKHNPVADRRDFSSLTGKALLFIVSLIPGLKNLRPRFVEVDKKTARALLVKLFFTPLMTKFFLDHFPHLINNVGYLVGTFIDAVINGHTTLPRFNQDVFNISKSFIFSIDVALAWCGYVTSSRWVNNQTVTAEPTVLGWAVCLMCYPPFQLPGLYYTTPGENIIFSLPFPALVTVFVILMVLSITVYMSATLWFGVRFSNVTNRGIIRKGPYALVRHPAYASKNFSWWCLMFPVIVYNATHSGLKWAILHTMGLILISWIYYMRAITEERHLSADPYYREYCKQVKHRFIPGVI